MIQFTKVMKETPKEVASLKALPRKTRLCRGNIKGVRHRREFHVCIFDTLSETRESLNFGMRRRAVRVAQNSRMLTKHLPVRVTFSLQLLRRCNGSFERCISRVQSLTNLANTRIRRPICMPATRHDGKYSIRYRILEQGD